MFLYKVKLNMYIETDLDLNFFWFCKHEQVEGGIIIEYEMEIKHPEEITNTEAKHLAYTNFFLRYIPVINQIKKINHLQPMEVIEKKWEDPYFIKGGGFDGRSK